MWAIVRIGAYFAFWAIMHYQCFAVFELVLAVTHPNYIGPDGIRARMKEKMSYQRLVCIRRMFRTELYCVLASALACYLLYTEYSSWPHDLLHQWGPLQEMGFEMAVAHWLLACFEDGRSGEEVIGHMTVAENARRGRYVEYMNGLTVHHILTICAYSWCLFTHKLSGLCVFGLLFELPIIILNARDIIASFSNWNVFNDTKQPIADKMFYLIWIPILLTWHSTRTAACLLWPLSLIIWRPELTTVPIVSRVVYHFLGILFNVVNIKLATQVVPQCAIEDLRRTASKMAAAAVAARHAGMPLDSKYPPGSRHPPSSDSTSQSLIGYEELAKHASSSDLWVAIEGKVYNLTDFAHGHPGGIDVIQRVAGKDASAAFLEAGHSNKARGMMSKFLVAHLTPHGYDQKGDTPLLGIWDGDITKAYVFGKRYTGYDHPMLLLMVVSAISIYLLSSSLQEVFANEEMLETGLFGIVCSLLMPATVTTLTLLTVVAAFDVPFLDHLLGTSDTMSTNPLLSVLAYMFTTFTVWNACLLMLWLFCDAWLLSGSLLVDAGVSAAVTCYRIGCVASLAAEVALKVLTDPPHELHGMLSLSTGLLFAAVLIDAFCFAGEMELTRTAALSAAGVTCTGAAARAAYLRSIHYIAAATSRRDPDFKGPGTGSSHYLLTMSSVLLAAIVSFVITTYMQYTSITADQSQTNLSLTSAMGVTLSAIWTLGDRYWTAAGCLTGFGLLLLGSLLRESNAAFTSMTSSMGGILFLWIVGPSIGYAQYVAFLIVLLGLLCLSKETSATLEKKGTAAPRWLYTAKQHEYKLRRTVAMLIHMIVGTPLQRLLRVLSPEYETYFYIGPIMDLGPEVELGVAYQLSAKKQGPPTNFQCNVGYMKSIEELIRTGMATKAMLQEIMEDPQAGEKGFVSDIVAHFYLNPQSFAGRNGYTVREVNLSAWTSEEAAYNWYKNSAAHKEIVKQHYGGGLQNFTPLLASLKPSPDRPIRYEVRCEACRKVVRGPNCDECPFCGAEMSHMPYF